MSNIEEELKSLMARVIALEARASSGEKVATNNKSNTDDESKYQFLSKLSGEDYMVAKRLIDENNSLRKQVEELEDVVEQKDFRIKHLKLGIDELL